MMGKEYTVKERYRPSRGENVIIRVAATAEHEETCISCRAENSCHECVLGLKREDGSK